MKTRIRELKSGMFIAEFRRSWFHGWEGIDKDLPKIFTYQTQPYKIKNCLVYTRKEAEKLIIDRFGKNGYDDV